MSIITPETSKFKLSTIPLPSKDFSPNKIDWGICGLCAIIAQESIIIYQITDNDIIFKNVIEFDERNIVSLKFCPYMSFLSFADDQGRLSLWDCEKGITIKSIKPFKESNIFINSLLWIDCTLIGITKTFVFGIDFFSNGNNLLWKADIPSPCNRIIKDPFNRFHCIAFQVSKDNQTSYLIRIFGINNRTAPNKIEKIDLDSQEPLSDAAFSPHIPDLIFLAFPSRVIGFIISSSSFSQITFDSIQGHIKYIIPSHNYFSVFYTLSHEVTLTRFTSSQAESFIPDSPLVLTKNVVVGQNNMILSNPQYPNYVLVYTGSLGLLLVYFKPPIQNSLLSTLLSSNVQLPKELINSLKNINRLQVLKNGIICRYNPLIPTQYNQMTASSFDSNDKWLALSSGKTVFLVDLMDIKRNLKILIGTKQDQIRQIKMMNNILIWATSKKSGSFDIPNRTLTYFDMRAGSVSKIFCSSEVTLLLRENGRAFGVYYKNNVKNAVFSKEIITVAIQPFRTPATTFQNAPNYAILLKNRKIVLLSALSSKAVQNLSCPAEFENPISIAWFKDTILIGDSFGKVGFYDLQYGTKKLINLPVLTLSQIISDGMSGFLCLYDSDKGALISKENIQKYSVPVKNFEPISPNIVLAELLNGNHKLLIEKEWISIQKHVTQDMIPVSASEVNRLKQLSSSILTIENTPQKLTIATLLSLFYGFTLDADVWLVLNRYLSLQTGQPFLLPGRLAMYGGREEIEERIRYLLFMFRGQSDPSVQKKTILLELHMGNMNKICQYLLSQKNYTSKIAGAFLSSLPDGKIPPQAAELLRASAVEMFLEKGSLIEGSILMKLAGQDIAAANYLLEKRQYNRALFFIKMGPKCSESKILTRKIALHFWEEGNLQEAMFLFLSVGDFHPTLALLVAMNKFILAFHLMMFLDAKEMITEFDGDLSKTTVVLPNLQTLRQNIVIKSDIIQT